MVTARYMTGSHPALEKWCSYLPKGRVRAQSIDIIVQKPDSFLFGCVIFVLMFFFLCTLEDTSFVYLLLGSFKVTALKLMATGDALLGDGGR